MPRRLRGVELGGSARQVCANMRAMTMNHLCRRYGHQFGHLDGWRPPADAVSAHMMQCRRCGEFELLEPEET